MKAKAGIFFILIILAVSLSGCATMGREKDLEIQGLRNQVTLLESQIQAKDEELAGLREALAKAEQGPRVSAQPAQKRKVIAEAKSKPRLKEVQIALKNAGYDPGNIDGKMGKQTRDAIKAFQSANNLKADGRVGKHTWALLKDYLYKKTK